MGLKQKTLKLSTPVEFAGMEYKELVFKKLKGKHLLEMGEAKTPIEQTFALAAASASVDVGVIHEMELDDIIAMQELLADFFPQGLRDKAQELAESSSQN
jgi:hypothetical protein